MQYLGGKAWLGKEIAETISIYRDPRALFVDLFCGALNVVRHVANPRIGIDKCQPLIVMWNAVLRGEWEPPDTLSSEEYARIKASPNNDDPLTAFAMFGCSFGGKWGAGYGGKPRPKYARPVEGAKKKVLEKARDCTGLQLYCFDYKDIPPFVPGTVIYCDPPYEDTTGYNAVGAFDSATFWRRAEIWVASGALVFVSEGSNASVPSGWTVLKEWGSAQGALGLKRTGVRRVERLFAHQTMKLG